MGFNGESHAKLFKEQWILSGLCRICAKWMATVSLAFLEQYLRKTGFISGAKLVENLVENSHPTLKAGNPRQQPTNLPSLEATVTVVKCEMSAPHKQFVPWLCWSALSNPPQPFWGVPSRLCLEHFLLLVGCWLVWLFAACGADNLPPPAIGCGERWLP